MQITNMNKKLEFESAYFCLKETFSILWNADLHAIFNIYKSYLISYLRSTCAEVNKSIDNIYACMLFVFVFFIFRGKLKHAPSKSQTELFRQQNKKNFAFSKNANFRLFSFPEGRLKIDGRTDAHSQFFFKDSDNSNSPFFSARTWSFPKMAVATRAEPMWSLPCRQNTCRGEGQSGRRKRSFLIASAER